MEGNKHQTKQAGRKNSKTKAGAGGRGTERQGPGHPGPETRESKKQGGARSRKKRKGKKKSRKGATRARRRPSTAEGQSGHRKGEVTRTLPGGRPARPGQEEQAHAHTNGTRAWCPLNQKEPRCTGRVPRQKTDSTGNGMRVHTRKPPHRTQPKTDAGGTRQGQPYRVPRKGTTRCASSALASAAASGRHQEPGSRPASAFLRSRPVNLGPKAPGLEKRHHGVRKSRQKHREPPDQTRGGAPLEATRLATEVRCRPQPRHTERCQETTATRCRKPGRCAHHATNHAKRTGARQHQLPSRWTCGHPAANPAFASYRTAAVPMGECAPGSGCSPCRLLNSCRPDDRVRARRVHSPCRLRIGAVRMAECASRGDAPHTQHCTPSAYMGEQEPRGRGHPTHNTKHNTPREHTGEQEPRD